MFKKVDPKQSFPKLEHEVLNKWRENDTFKKSVEQRSKDNAYVFYDGPPFATGLPHYGHILAGTMKDVVPRYWTMRGKRVERRFGWDCHGLPVENVVEKELGLSGKKEIEEKVGIADFNEKCRASVLKYTAEWEQTVMRMGRWVDFKNDYKTMDPEFMESIWWVFRQLWDKDLVYKGNKNMLVCPHCVTPLSNFESSLNYQDKKDNSIAVKMFLAEESARKIAPDSNKPVAMIPWTTTPWTLPGNMAMIVAPHLDYVLIEEEAEFRVFGKAAAERYYEDQEMNVVKVFKGSELCGFDYIPPFSYHKKEDYADYPKVFTILNEDVVNEEEGTGIIHSAVTYGDEEDFEIAERNNLPFIHHVGMDGRFKDYVTEFAGKYWKNAEDDVANALKERDAVISYDKYKHSYPHCWRCDEPLMYNTLPAWFVSVDKIKERMLANNQEIHWVPGHIKDGRFGKWLENARDWCISRNRFWGAPLPIWESESGDDYICIGSVEELEKLSGEKVEDLHKHFVDEIVIEKDGKKYHRVPEVLDCWFESGSMPYAQCHYPFENKEWFEDNFPAQFIAEGLDQTRGWFYTLVILGTALFDKAPFRNVIVNGIILAEDGKKMSKRLKNYPDPAHIFDEYGADALRFYLMNSPVVKAEKLRFSEKGVADVVRTIMLPLWNSYSFFVTYANIDGWTPEKLLEKKNNRLDKWVISEFEELLKELTDQLDQYDLQKATEPIAGFIASLTNWYIRRSRRRFWKSENDTDKDEAYSTLYHVLRKLSMVLAPFMPFVAEEIYTNLTGEESVHLADWPAFEQSNIDLELNREMELVQQIVSLGLSVRAKHNLKVRQPLASVEVVGSEELSEQDIQMIKEELNVKDVIFSENADELAEKIAKPIGSKIGPKYGAVVQDIIKNAKDGNFEEMEDGKILVKGEWELEKDDYEMVYEGKEGHFVAGDKGVVVSLDGNLTAELKQEGLARDLVRYIQDARKEAGFEVSDHIELAIDAGELVKAVVDAHKDYISSETLADALVFDQFETCDFEKELELENEDVRLYLKRSK